MTKDFVKEICKELNIDVPEVVVDPSKLSETMLAATNGKTIWLKNNEPSNELFLALAHELRHIWQVKYHEDKYMPHYIKSTETDNIESYNMQIAEIDAHAYALLIIDEYFGVQPLYENLSERTRKAIFYRADEILSELEYE